MNDESRPKAAPESIAADSSSVALFGEISRQIGAESMMFAILDAGRQLAPEAARTIWIHPRFVELQKLREVTHEPCSTRSCGGYCSRCVHAESWSRRGERPYLGVEAERARPERP